jgi:hypothetical protein
VRMWAFLVALWPGVLKVQSIDGRIEAPGLGELVSAGESAGTANGHRGCRRISRQRAGALAHGAKHTSRWRVSNVMAHGP